MSRILYLINRIIHLDYANMFKICKSISKKTKKNRFFLAVDMIYCGIVYQAGYYDYQEFEFYNLNKKERSTYLTRGKNNEIIKRFNDKSFFPKFEDKIEFNKLFSNFISRDWMYLDNNLDEFVEFFNSHKDIIVKPIDGSGGKGIEKYTYVNSNQAKKLFTSLVENNQLLVEGFIKQHPEMNRLYDKSVNTLRMFTFIKDGQPHFLQAILKIGNGGVVDNFSSGGMYTYVNDDGVVFVEAIDQADNVFYTHPVSNTQIVGFKVPMFKEAVDMVKECSKVVPQVAYVGWDVAISESGPEIVEGNCFPGVFQVKSSLSNNKTGLIPKYNELMHIF